MAWHNGKEGLRVQHPEKGARISAKVERVIFWNRQDGADWRVRGLAGAYLGYCREYKVDSQTNAAELLMKPKGKKGLFPFLVSNFREWLRKMVKRTGVKLRSLGGMEITGQILRRSAMSCHGTISPVHVVQRLAHHADIKTTANFYLGLEKAELIEVQSAHARIILQQPNIVKEPRGHLEPIQVPPPIRQVPPPIPIDEFLSFASTRPVISHRYNRKIYQGGEGREILVSPIFLLS